MKENMINIVIAGILAILFLYGLCSEIFFISNKLKKELFCFSVILLIIFACIRTRGWDFENYREIFQDIPIDFSFSALFNFKVEFGYVFLTNIFKILHLNFRIFIVFISFITIVLYANSIKKNSSSPFLAISIFYFLFFIRGPYGQIRQALCMAVLMYSIKFVKEKNLIKFIFAVLIAYSIHYVGIAFIPIYFVCNIKYSSKTLYIVLILSLFVSFFSKYVIDIFLHIDASVKFIQKLKNYNTLFLIERKAITLDMIRYSIFSLIVIRRKNSLIGFNSNNKIIINIFLIGAVAYNILSFNLTIAYRVSRIFTIFEIFLITDLINTSKIRFNKYFINIILIIFCLYKIALEFYMLKVGIINYYL